MAQKELNECDKDSKKSASQSYLSRPHIPVYDFQAREETTRKKENKKKNITADCYRKKNTPILLKMSNLLIRLYILIRL